MDRDLKKKLALEELKISCVTARIKGISLREDQVEVLKDWIVVGNLGRSTIIAIREGRRVSGKRAGFARKVLQGKVIF